jgi:TP901 family phage tail tape measure protein
MAINLDVHGNTTPLEAEVRAAVNRIRKIPVKLSIDDKGATQPLGNMRRGADEFTKSMEAANARIIAFGASMAIINGVGNAFKALVRDVVEVEKSLADINVVMDLSTEKLDKFSDGLFKVAKETGQAFKVAADAATEYARQGLGVEESLRRTKDALILTRLTGMDSAEAVKSLTAAMNTYGHQIENTTQLVSKFAAVDVKFAVSAEDFADAISRTGSAAKGAGVDIDELIGIVTAAQQKTARGGKVIGNSLKTIFTRVGRADTLNQLENLGIAVRDIEGNTLGAKKILTDLANTFDTLSEAQKAQIAQTVGGVFQINVLKAILGDAAKQNGILANATQISANATDEAIQKNEMLRGTIAAMASETGTAIKQLSSDIGEIALAPGIEKILSTVKGFAENLSGVLGDGESTGNRFATGLLKGIGNIITGPGLVVLVGVFFKLFGQAFKFTRDSLSSLIGITSEAQKQKAIQTSLVDLMGRNANLNKELLRTDIGRSEKEKIILGYLKAQVAEANVLNNISKQLASTLYTKGYGANLTPVRRGRAHGYVPNFAHPEREEAAKGGYAAGNIRSMHMPGEGSIIYNSAEKVKNFKGMTQPAIMPPESSKAGKKYQQAFGDIHGFDPYAAGGYIPNYSQTTANADRRMVVFAASTQGGGKFGGQDNVNNKFFISPPKKKNESYKFADVSKQGARGASPRGMIPVNVPYFTIGKNDAKLNNHPDVQSFIYAKMKKAGQAVAQDVANKLFKVRGASVKKIETKDIAASSGNIFEAAIMAAQNKVARESMGPDPVGNTLLDIPRKGRDKLWDLFGAGTLGGLGAEAKIALGGLASKAGKHLKSAAEKFYKVDIEKKAAFGGQAPKTNFSQSSALGGLLTKKGKDIYVGGEKFDNLSDEQSKKLRGKGLEPGGKTGMFSFKQLENLPFSAGGYIPNFAAMAISRLGGLGKSKFGLAAVINSNPYFSQLLKRYGHWKNFPSQEKTKLNKFLLKQGFTNRTLQGYGIASMHGKSIGEGISNVAAAGGYIPNFANPLSDAIGRERAAGVPVSQIRVGSHGALMNKDNPLGLGVTNTKDEPNGLRDVFGANGYVPNYFNPFSFAKDKIIQTNFAKQMTLGASNLEDYNKKLKKHKQEQQKHSAAVSRIEKQLQRNLLSQKEVDRLNKKLATAKKHEAAASRRIASTARGTGVGGFLGRSSASMGRAFSGNAGMMMMMGAPMAAGFVQQGGMGAEGGSQAMYAAGGALSGAASGAMMASMLAPMFGPAAPLVIGVGGLLGGVKGLISANEENTKALKEKSEQELKAQIQSTSQAVSQIAQGSELSRTLSSAGITAQSIATLGLKGGDTVLQGLQKSKVGHSAPQALVDVMKQYEAGKMKPVSQEKLNRQIDVILKNAEKGGKQFEKTRSQLGAFFAPRDRDDMRRYKDVTSREEALEFLSKQNNPIGRAALYTKTAREYMGGTGDPDFYGIKTKQQLELTSSGQARSELIDYLMENEKKQSFAYDFGQEKGGTGYLDKAQYAALLKGQEVDIGGQIGPQKLSEAAIQEALTKESQRIQSEYVNAQTQQKEALILQLNLQKAQIIAQQASADAQFKIKAEYIKQSNLLQMQEKLMGSFISDKQKAENKYTDSLNKAAKAYNAGAESAKLSLKTGIMQDILQNPVLEQALKQALFTGTDSKDITKQDLTNKLAKMDDKELIDTLRNIKVAEDDINEIIENRSLLYGNQIINLERQQSLSVSQAANEKQINLVLSERKEILDDMSKRMEDFASRSQFLSEKGGLERRISAAQREGTGYISADRQLQIQRSEMEKYTIPGLQRQGRAQKESILEKVGVGFSDEEQKQIMTMRGKDLDIAEVVKAQRGREFEEKGGSAKILELQQFVDNPFNAFGEGRTEAQMKEYAEKEAKLNELKTLDAERNKLSDDLNKKISAANRDLKEQNVLNKKNVDTVNQEMLARERMHDRMTGPKAVQNGMQDSFAKMADNADKMRYQIGERIPNLLADGLAQAMQVGLNGAEDIGDAMRQIGINFLQAIQSAFLQHAAHSIVGNMGFNLTKNEGGKIPRYSTGGSVPAMVTDGEYVMSRQAVNKYGGAFMHGLNVRGSAPEKFSQGGLADAFGKLGTYQDSGLGQAFQNLDRGKMNNVYSKMSKAQPRQMTMDRMKTAQMQEKSLQDFFSNPAKAQKGGPDLANKTVLNNLMDNKSIKPNPGSSGLIGNLLGGIFSIITAPFKMIGNIFGGLGKYQGGLIPQDIQKFAEGGGVENGIGAALLPQKEEEPKPGTLISAHGGRRYHSGRKYTKNRMSGFFYSQSGNVGLREDAEGLRNELAKEEAARRAREAKKAKKKQFIMSLVGAAGSALISHGLSGGFGGKSFPEGSKGDFLQKTGRLEVNPELGYNNNFSAMVYHGGKINKYASGGHISGKPGIDQIPAMLSEGEYVIRASSARKLGRSKLDQINAGRFYDGGSVSSDDETKQETSSSSGNTNNISISVNVTNGSKAGENSESSITNSGEDNRDQADKQKQMAEKIKEQVVSVIVEEQRPGGLLSKTES